MNNQNDNSFQSKLNKLLFETNDYENNIFINNFAILLCYTYFSHWEVEEYSKNKYIWLNKITNGNDNDGKFIVRFLLTEFQDNLRLYKEYLMNIMKTEYILSNDKFIATQKFNTINELHNILLDKEFHEKLIYYMTILS
jgi:hypothetical protein